MAEERFDSPAGNGRPDGQNTQEVESEPREEIAAEAPSLEQQVEEEKKKAAEYLDNWRRSAAEFSNYKKRAEKEKSDYGQFANAILIAKLLDVMDGFDAAFRAIPDQFKNEPWVEGIRLVEQKLQRVLESEGVKPIEAQGKDFDPNYHEAMFYETSAGEPEGRVIAEFQRGYMLGNKVLRPTRVKVAKGDQKETSQQQNR